MSPHTEVQGVLQNEVRVRGGACALLPVLAALRAEIDEAKLGPHERADVRHWYWSNVFLERYSSAVESKSRKDYAEMQRW